MTKTWLDFIGFAPKIAALRQAHELRGLPNACLVQGRSGSGKRMFAAAMCALYFCESKNACGQCKGCWEVVARNQADILWLDTEDGIIKLADAELVQDHLQMKPFTVGGRRIAIISHADKLNRQAANRLLKIIEEPAADSMIILTTARPKAMLPTILSRCVKFRVGLPPKADVLSLLRTSSKDLSEARLEHIWVMAGGTVGAALQQLEASSQSEADEQLDLVYRTNDRAAVLAQAELLDKLKLAPQEWGRQFEYWLNKVYKQADCPASDFVQPERIRKRREILKYLKAYRIAFNSRLNLESLALASTKKL